jgi:hypothetical protein
LGVKDFAADRYVRQVGKLLLSIAEKSIGSGVEAANRADPIAPQALFLVELAEGGTISVSEVAANVKVKPTFTARLNDKWSRAIAWGKKNRKDGGGPQAASADRGKQVADVISRNYLGAIGRALEGASRRERENLLTMLIIIDESFGMEVEGQRSRSATGRLA